MGCDPNDRRAFRCCIASENSAGKLKVGSKLVNVCVLDTSRNGFCVQVPSQIAKKLKEKSPLVLHFAGEQWEVQVKSRYSDSEEFTNLGLARVRDLTKLQMPATWTRTFTRKADSAADPTFLAFLVLAFLTAAVCLPGIGDHLGTAPKVRKAINAVVRTPR